MKAPALRRLNHRRSDRDEKKVTIADRRVISITVDTTKPETIAAAAQRAGDVTLLINNAGVLAGLDVLTTSRSELEAAFRTNVYGTLDVIKPRSSSAPSRASKTWPLSPLSPHVATRPTRPPLLVERALPSPCRTDYGSTP